MLNMAFAYPNRLLPAGHCGVEHQCNICCGIILEESLWDGSLRDLQKKNDGVFKRTLWPVSPLPSLL